MKDIDDVVLAYEEALRLGKGKVSPRMTIREQAAKYRRSQQINQAIIVMTRDTLAWLGVTTIMYPLYTDFALKVLKLMYDGWRGHALEREVQTTQKSVARYQNQECRCRLKP